MEQFKIDSHFNDFGHIKIDPACLFLLILGTSHLFHYGQYARSPKTI